MKGNVWLNWAAVVTWAVVSLPALVDVISGRLAIGHAITWGMATSAFGLLLYLCIWPSRVGARHRIPLLLLQSLCGLIITWTNPNGAAAATLVIVAAQVPHATGVPVTWAWVLVQTAILIAIFGGQTGIVDAVAIGVAFGGFQMFAVATTFLAISERRAREGLAMANAELTATRELMAENSRVGERLRIARDLHDTLGHHLTALSLQLDVASRLSAGQAAEQHVIEAHAITRLLLSDVREVVSQMRESSQIDLAGALRGLVTSARSLRIDLDMPERLEFGDPAQANAMLRAVQEIITNASRHAGASRLAIRITQSSDGVTLDARDDGRGMDVVVPGNGLRGMRERFEAQKGRLDIVTAAGQGFEVHGVMPRPEASA
ncbi:MAG: sensor histidine kinase [Vicinamibacterales bacterium]